MKRVTLNSSEKVLAVQIACGRTDNNERKNFTEKKQCDRSGWDINFEGVCGEIAGAKYLQVYPDTEYNVDNPPKHDVVSRTGVKIDIKTADKNKDFWSTIISKSVDDVERYLFVRGRFPDYDICGWLDSSDYINDDNICDVGNGNFYGISINNINKL